MTLEEYLKGDKQVKATCAICGNSMIVRDTSKGVMFTAENLPIHIKCLPKDKYLIQLKDAILQAFTYHHGNEEVLNRGLNWMNIMSQIKSLCSKGFSIEEQLNCFNNCMKRKGEFWGYGTVLKSIDSDTLLYRKYKEEKLRTDGISKVKEIIDEPDTVVMRVFNNDLVGRYDYFNARFDEEDD